MKKKSRVKFKKEHKRGGKNRMRIYLSQMYQKNTKYKRTISSKF